MPESRLHVDLKVAAMKWLWEQGYAAIAEEVVVPGVGVIDVAGAGLWKRPNPRRVRFERDPVVERHHVVFVECKALRADFLHDLGRQRQFEFALSERREALRRRRRRHPRRASPALGKFDSCVLRPHAHLNWLCTPLGLLKPSELPRRWGWLVVEGSCVRVRRRPDWQEVADSQAIEGAIARSLTTRRMKTWYNATSAWDRMVLPRSSPIQLDERPVDVMVLGAPRTDSP